MEIVPLHHFSTSQLSARPWSNSRKAWHLLSLLVKIGGPTTSSELAHRCTSFPATAETVESLCCIPGSPISMIDDHFVSLSSLVIASQEHASFFTTQITGFTSRVEIRVRTPEWPWEITLQTYSRKRKRLYDSSDAISLTSKRAMLEPMCLTGENKENEGDHVTTSMVSGVYCMSQYYLHSIDGGASATTTSFPVNLHIGDSNEVIPVVPSSPDQRDADRDVTLKANDYYVQDTQSKIFEIEPCLNDQGRGVSVRELQIQFHFEAQLLQNWLGIISENQVSTNQQNDSGVFSPEMQIVIGTVNHGCASENVGDSRPAECINIVDRSRFDLSVQLKKVEPCKFSDNVCQVNESVGIDLKEINQPVGNGMQPSPSYANLENLNMNQAIVSPAIEVADLPKPAADMHARMESFSGSPPKATPEVIPDSFDCLKLTNLAQEKEIALRSRKLNSTTRKIPVGNADKLVAQKEATPLKHSSNEKELPCFELFTVEEEEGSGGYGTVYRAQRKSDGVRVAIKCPHKNAHKHHVSNEKRMLDRFGGKHFIIRCMGSFEDRDSDCFVLEHVEHDRPEVLKREIDIFELQWYGFCMFKALESLHKQVVVHRDVKPGNFLFSRTMVKGYLIDFNLALDLRRKVVDGNKPKDQCAPKSATVVKPTKSKETMKLPYLVRKTISKETTVVTKPFKSNRKKEDGQAKKLYSDYGASIRSQGAEGSGITSAKDGTTPSGDRLKEPMPCHGRKELINIVQQALHNSTHQTTTLPPSSKRKRVTAVPDDYNPSYLTPMPLNLGDLCVARGGFLKGKYNKEGPCVGTKGFRAPEVLLRSGYQGTKVDIWSAGVTLLYLMIGRAPFNGDPEQNIKEIAKLRGSEDLWEVAKLHDREVSFPKDLYDTQWLPGTRLKEWCMTNTKRPKFLELIPNTLFDLVDKCLTVNPRQRITAEEALSHEFFNPCHERLKKRRLNS